MAQNRHYPQNSKGKTLIHLDIFDEAGMQQSPKTITSPTTSQE